MTDRLATVHLHGPLAEAYGTPHRLAVSTPVEAVRALDANYPGFVAAFAKHEIYALHADGDWRDGDAAASMPFSRELHIAPLIEGRAPLGAILVGAAFPAIAGTMAATIIGGLLMAGIMFGLSYLLTPKPKKESGEEHDENYAFSGPENVTGQGVAVPLIYGRVHAGSVVISAGLDLGTDLSATVPNPAAPQGPPSTAVQPGLPEPPGGWPPIVTDNQGRPGPQGWKVIGTTHAISGMNDVPESQQGYAKIVTLWQHPTARTYYYNRVRGYYGTPLYGYHPQEYEYERGGHD